MGLVRENKGRWRSAVLYGNGSYATGSFTPPDSSLLVVVCHIVENTGTSDPSGVLTIADSAGLTWAPRVNIGNATSWSCGIRIWTAPVTTGASMTVTVDCGTRNAYFYVVDVLAYTGYDTGTPTGATASDGAMATNGADSITLSGAPASESEVVAALLVDFASFGVSNTVYGTGWTEIYDSQDAEANSISQLQVRTGSTSTTVGWDDVHDGVGAVAKTVGLALEIKAAPAGGSEYDPIPIPQPLPAAAGVYRSLRGRIG